MADNFITKLNKNKLFHKSDGLVEVWAIFNSSANHKFFMPMLGTQPLSACVIDAVSQRYCIYGSSVELIKRFEFVPTFIVDDKSVYRTFFPLPKDYVWSTLNKKEKEKLINTASLYENTEIEFFQTMILHGK
jgi:hypothetical protein